MMRTAFLVAIVCGLTGCGSSPPPTAGGPAAPAVPTVPTVPPTPPANTNVSQPSPQPMGQQPMQPMPQQPSTPKAPVTADFTVDAVTLSKEFLDDANAALNKYRGKTVIVNGKVEAAGSIGNFGGLRCNFAGATNPIDNSIVKVSCAFESNFDNSTRLSGLKPGQDFAVKGASPQQIIDGEMTIQMCQFVD